MRGFYAVILIALNVSAMSLMPAQPKAGTSPQTVAGVVSSGVHDFDFLAGDWRVHHRYLRSKDSHREWLEYDGTCRNHQLMNGQVNMDEHELNGSTGAYEAIALRSFDAKSQEWAIWWLDGRYPSGPLDPPVKGKFERGVGTFYSDDQVNGKPVRTRFTSTPTSARWEQAVSVDGERLGIRIGSWNFNACHNE
jgi:hypothetical protein